MLVRETLTGVGETIGLEGIDLNDVRTAVTEACNNVVLHAYDGEEGPLEVEIQLAAGAIEVLVRDRGVGLKPQVGADPWVVGIGLPVIQALVSQVEFADTEGGGTEVRMKFATPATRELTPLEDEEFEPPSLSRAELANTTTVTIAPASPLARTVLPRLLGVLAARARFSTDRLSDALLVADALVAHAPAPGSPRHLTVAVSVLPRNLDLRLGPLETGLAQQLLSNSDIDGAGGVIEKLTDHQLVALDGSAEVLNLRLTDSR